MTPRYSPAKRLSEAFKLFPPLGKTQFRLVRENGEVSPSGEIFDLQDVGDQVVEVMKRNLGPYVMTLTDKPRDACIKTAFADAKLNPDDPYHWRTLIYFFAWAHFGDRRRRGAPQKWDSLRLQRFLNDFNELRSRHPKMFTESILKNLGNKSAYQTKKGKPLSTSQLRKMLKQARDPKHNELLNALERKPDNL